MAFFEKRPNEKNAGEKNSGDRPAAERTGGERPSGGQAKPGANDPKRADAAATAKSEAKPATAKSDARLVSLDAYRGFIMLMMASGGFAIAKIAKEVDVTVDGVTTKSSKLIEAGIEPGSWASKTFHFFAWQLDHAAWQGGVFWDLIQPAFMFMVGVALPFSYARRAGSGDSYLARFGHMLVRSAVLVLLAVFLSTGSNDRQTNFIFPNVLAQIGLGYPFLFLFVNRGLWVQLAGVVAICGGMWFAFYQHPLPSEGFDYKTVGLKETDDATDFVPAGLGQHWAYNTNWAAEQDRTILNWFPREKPFEFNAGGYATLNFVTALATMLLGLIAGEWLRGPSEPGEKVKRLLIGGAICLALGLALGYTVCPIVKRIWTPSWVFASAGPVLWMLAAFYWLIDVCGWKRLAWPLAVVGMNSIVMYVMSQLLKPWTARTLKLHFGLPFQRLAEWWSAGEVAAAGAAETKVELFGGPFGEMYQSIAVLFCLWLVCVWLWRQKIFVRV